MADHEKPVIRSRVDGQYTLRYRGQTYGPFRSWDAAEQAGLQLLAKVARHG